MFKTILVASDGSEQASKALDAALELARLNGASLTILTATDPVATGIGSGGFGTIDAGPIVARLEEAYASEAADLLAKARHRAQEAGITPETLHLPRHRPADAILETATERGVDLIVMGSHGRRGLNRLLLGSQVAEVLARSTLPVLVVK
ncbi:universal stress protein [Devosia sediminis]|uniref:Universal stress protein n=1 Tax=Devosia sediminis TaxID=2798801 RepID=A0A934MIS6_9HYPH|nr:universal stress protein [Devosia sediminis]MBJ3786527.1 universal stress protein [Devosia sediminis]